MKTIIKGAILSAMFTSSLAFSHGENGSVGAGIGASYGLVGGSVDIPFSENLYGSVGLGNAFGELGYNAGVRYYLADANRTWRPRLVVNYGTIGVVQTETCFFDLCSDEEYEAFVGTSFGVGQSVAFGSNHSHGFDIDLLYIADDGGRDERIKELEDEGFELKSGKSKALFSIGYRFNF